MQAGLLDTYHAPVRRRGLTAWALSAVLFAAYLLLYFTEVFTPPAVALDEGGVGDPGVVLELRPGREQVEEPEAPAGP